MITALDLQRITNLIIDKNMMGQIASLENKIGNSEVVESELTPENLVTMNSQVRVFDLTTNEEISLRLVYQLSPLYGNQTSIFSPLGTALLGMKLYETAAYRLRDGSIREVRVEEIIFQPEKNKSFDL